MESKLFFKASKCFVPFIAVTFSIYQIVTNFRDRYNSFPTGYLAIADLPVPVFSDLPLQFSGILSVWLCDTFSASVNGLRKPRPLMCEISCLLFSFGICALLQGPTDFWQSREQIHKWSKMHCTVLHRGFEKNSCTYQYLHFFTRYRKTSLLVHLQTSKTKQDPAKT